MLSLLLLLTSLISTLIVIVVIMVRRSLRGPCTVHRQVQVQVLSPVLAPSVQAPPQNCPNRIAIDPNAGMSAPGTYPQLGYLKPSDGSAVLPLYGRPSIRRGRGFYYTILPGSGIKVPLMTGAGTGSGAAQRDCMEDVGCEQLYSGDHVTIPDTSQSVGVQWEVVVYKYNRH